MLTIYLWVLTGFVVWTIVNSLFMPALKNSNIQGDKDGLVSILIPLRNEEANVVNLIKSLEELTYPNLEIILLDDHSTDNTLELLQGTTVGDDRFTIIKGKELPECWTGKVYACHQLSLQANGAYLLFIDADLRLAPGAVQSSLALMKRRKAALLTGFPSFPVKLWLEKLLVPLQHFVVHFHLPLGPSNWTTLPSFTAAHGAFIMVNNQAYQTIGGHKGIYNTLLDDVDLTRIFKKHGYRAILANVTNYAKCYMYHSNREVWNGFTKNLFPGLGRSGFLVSFLFCFYGIFYVAPLFLFFAGLFKLANGTLQLELLYPYLLIVLQKAWVDVRTKQVIILSFFMPISALAFMVLLIHSMRVGLKRKGYVWKGRTYS
ncbi:glycosyltransferase [Pseudalkalibacillus hwajinpoensis]|uniref:4,4'-diaponeurosporenoate glycosyltransferase n=1 Tax=Guptibacillus hwajinpoensis TaxID=208199 RepID=A0A4U1ML93_9BACL|nr:glycosyltransferase family 2 protein [Pseudalkalibacillus hwajinpoensis]TKD71471.1 glycosyltransferase [Pseudalkalibacillus hwajinpoensis]